MYLIFPALRRWSITATPVHQTTYVCILCTVQKGCVSGPRYDNLSQPDIHYRMQQHCGGGSQLMQLEANNIVDDHSFACTGSRRYCSLT